MSDTKQKFNVETLGNCPPEVAQYCAKLENINAELLEALEDAHNELIEVWGAEYLESDDGIRSAALIAKAKGEDQ